MVTRHSTPRVLLSLLTITGLAIVAHGGATAAPAPGAQFLTEPEELAIGRQFSLAVQAQLPLINDPVLERYVNHRGRLIADHSSRPNIPYFFKVVDDPEINAFALPGGHIFLNLGMIHAAETEAEMLGIVAHEIGHSVGRHFVRQQNRGFWLNLAQNAAISAYPNYYAYVAENLFFGATFMKFGRDAEREADAFGYQFLVDSGFDPEGMVRMFVRLLERYQRDPGALEKLFITHPPTQERIDNLTKMIATNPPPPGVIRDTEIFQSIRTRVEELYANHLKERQAEEDSGQ